MNSEALININLVTKGMRVNRLLQKPFILWFTGLSGSGKSTISREVEARLFETGKFTYLLDGDVVRRGLNRDLGYDKTSRTENIRRIGEVSKLFLDSGIIVLCAFISPYKEDRDLIRNSLEDNEFIEIFIDVPFEVCEARSNKDLYLKAKAGKLQNFTGMDSPYEKPTNPDIHIDNHILSIEESTNKIISYLIENNFLV